MQFRIADTFTDSLARLTGQEQKAIKITVFDLQTDPANPGMQFHKLDKVKDPNFWSVRVSRDIRLIVHRTDRGLLLCYVNHHDAAYRWAERRRLKTHPKTGAAQIVEIRETVQEIIVPKYVEVEEPVPPKPLLFADVSDKALLGYGVPSEWIQDVKAATEDTLLELVEHLPGEAAEALLDLATGTTPTVAPSVAAEVDPFDHPDAQRRFRVMSNVEELERALDYPWDKWTIFLHPAQRETVEKAFNGPARVSGTAGTGKTIVALHRAVYLADMHPESRVLLTTFSETLANMLRTKLRRLISNRPRIGERLEVQSMDAIGRRLYELNGERPSLVARDDMSRILEDAASEVEGHNFTHHFLITEWEQVVDAWRLGTWEEYRDVRRLGRKVRLPEGRRKLAWSIFERARAFLTERMQITISDMFTKLAATIESSSHPPYDFAVVDESQDLSVPQLRFLAALGRGREDCLFFAGDLGQRVFQQPFSWKSLGVDIRGRSRNLRINYRTSHQIRIQADRLLDPESSDVDGNVEDRRGAISVFNGPKPDIVISESVAREAETAAAWLSEQANECIEPHEIGVFVRSSTELDRARKAVEGAGLMSQVLNDKVEPITGRVSLCTMHLAKGLEFKAVAVLACDDEIIPLQERIETVTDDSDLEEVYNTERHLLYVACTRARDHLLVSGVDPGSEFLEDLSLEPNPAEGS